MELGRFFASTDGDQSPLGKQIKIVTEYLSIRDLATQFSEVTGEKAGVAVEMTREQFEASRYADHPAAEFMYFSWEFVIRAGPDSGYRVSPEHRD